MKVPGTPAPPKGQPVEEPVMEVMQPPPPPLEMVIHQAGVGVRRIETPDGNLTLIQLMSPVGIMFTLKFDDDGIEYLKSQLTGSNVIVPPKGIILPG